jgi:hypothetical protein
MRSRSLKLLVIMHLLSLLRSYRYIIDHFTWGVLDGKISYAITYPGASMQSSDLVHPI